MRKEWEAASAEGGANSSLLSSTGRGEKARVAGPKRIALLGSTGSIGCQTLDVVAQHPDKLSVVALAAGSRVAWMLEQAKLFNVHYCAAGDAAAASQAKSDGLVPQGAQLEVGPEAIEALVRLPEVDIVVNALVGAAGMRASYETLRAGKVLALANKESLVVAGDLLCSAAFASGGRLDAASASGGTEAPCAGRGAAARTLGFAAAGAVSGAREALAEQGEAATEDATRTSSQPVPCTHPASLIRPIDSEHGAIFQCLLGEDPAEVACLWVTASGGPFRGWSRAQLADVTPAQALAHPTWNMGPKITIDSSTLMNKGLEVIEAHHLFAMPYDRIKVVVQPQSAIHSMVEFADGSVKAHLGTTDMRIPIQFALSCPQRWEAPVQPLDFCQLGSLEFAAPDTETFRCLALARQAGERGGTLPCAMNAANEVAVAAFLEERLDFLGIANTVEAVMEACAVEPVASIDQLAEVDAWARRQAASLIGA